MSYETQVPVQGILGVDDGNAFPLANSYQIRGTHKIFDTESEMTNIPGYLLILGQTCFVRGTGITYRLRSITPRIWDEISTTDSSNYTYLRFSNLTPNQTIIKTIAENESITLVMIDIEAEFNNEAIISLGTSNDVNAVIHSDDVLKTRLGLHVHPMFYAPNSVENIYLFISNCTSGSGKIKVG